MRTRAGCHYTRLDRSVLVGDPLYPKKRKKTKARPSLT
jgi:hypothetical protein